MDPLPVETPLPQPRPIKPLWRTGVALVCKKCSGNKKSDLRRGQPPTFLIVGTEEREALYAQLASAVPRPH
jgi:hypothetical protein